MKNIAPYSWMLLVIKLVVRGPNRMRTTHLPTLDLVAISRCLYWDMGYTPPDTYPLGYLPPNTYPPVL